MSVYEMINKIKEKINNDYSNLSILTKKINNNFFIMINDKDLYDSDAFQNFLSKLYIEQIYKENFFNISIIYGSENEYKYNYDDSLLSEIQIREADIKKFLSNSTSNYTAIDNEKNYISSILNCSYNNLKHDKSFEKWNNLKGNKILNDKFLYYDEEEERLLA